MKALQVIQTIFLAALLYGFWVNSTEVARIAGRIEELSSLTVRLSNLESRVTKIEKIEEKSTP